MSNTTNTSNIQLINTQMCHALCTTQYCNGPNMFNCLPCAAGCSMCTGPTSYQCTKCTDTTTKILTSENGINQCITNQPTFWNQLYSSSQLKIFYGFDATLQWVYYDVQSFNATLGVVGIQITPLAGLPAGTPPRTPQWCSPAHQISFRFANASLSLLFQTSTTYSP